MRYLIIISFVIILFSCNSDNNQSEKNHFFIYNKF